MSSEVWASKELCCCVFSKWNLFPFKKIEQQKVWVWAILLFKSFWWSGISHCFIAISKAMMACPGPQWQIIQSLWVCEWFAWSSLANQTLAPWCVSTSTQKVASLMALKVESWPFNKKTFQHHVYVALNWYNIKYPNKLEDFKTKDPTNCCLPRGYDLSSCRGFRCECVTWGAPRLGDASFAQLFKEQKIKLARMVNRQQCLGMVWGWFGDGLGMVWGWFGDGLGMVGICKFLCGNCLRVQVVKFDCLSCLDLMLHITLQPWHHEEVTTEV